MDSEEVKNFNVTVNETLGFVNHPILQNVLRILIFMYISKTCVNVPAIDKALSTSVGKISALTIALWLGNKNFVHSLVISALTVLALQFLGSK